MTFLDLRCSHTKSQHLYITKHTLQTSFFFQQCKMTMKCNFYLENRSSKLIFFSIKTTFFHLANFFFELQRKIFTFITTFQGRERSKNKNKSQEQEEITELRKCNCNYSKVKVGNKLKAIT